MPPLPRSRSLLLPVRSSYCILHADVQNLVIGVQINAEEDSNSDGSTISQLILFASELSCTRSTCSAVSFDRRKDPSFACRQGQWRPEGC